MNKPKYTTEECLKEYYISLEEKLKEKDAMIDWLSLELAKVGNRIPFTCPPNVPYEPLMGCVSKYGSCANCWRKAAQEAVKRND